MLDFLTFNAGGLSVMEKLMFTIKVLSKTVPDGILIFFTISLEQKMVTFNTKSPEQNYRGWHSNFFKLFFRKHDLAFHVNCLLGSEPHVCLFDLGLTSLSTIFQSYCDCVWMWQEAQCSLLECCLTEISHPRHFGMIFHPVTLYWHWADQF